MNRRSAKVRSMPRRPEQDCVTTLLRDVRRGGITGERFCVEVSKLAMADRTRLLDSLLRDYKDLNNFTLATSSEDKAAS
jgi:hypothetical protein